MLLVDDEENVFAALRRLLLAEGRLVLGATSAEQALQLMARHEYSAADISNLIACAEAACDLASRKSPALSIVRSTGSPQVAANAVGKGGTRMRLADASENFPSNCRHAGWQDPVVSRPPRSMRNGTGGRSRTCVLWVQGPTGMPATHGSCIGSGGRNRTCVGCVQSAAGMPATHT